MHWRSVSQIPGDVIINGDIKEMAAAFRTRPRLAAALLGL